MRGRIQLVRAATTLHVHRNTLVYRLGKITQLTGRPVRDYPAAIALYLACLSDQLDETAGSAAPEASSTFSMGVARNG